MTTKEFIHKVFYGELGQLDALNKSFEITNKEKLRIEMLITEIDQFLNLCVTVEPRYQDQRDRPFVFPTSFSRDRYHFNGFPPKEKLGRVNQLKTDLLSFLDSQNETPSTNKKQSKGVWKLATRYKFLDNLGVVKPLVLLCSKAEGMQKNDLNRIVSQILGCDVSTARDLINKSYTTKETKDEQFEREQLEALIKQHQVDKKG